MEMIKDYMGREYTPAEAVKIVYVLFPEVSTDAIKNPAVRAAHRELCK